MLIKQIIEFQLRVLNHLTARVLYTWLFPWQSKNLKRKSSSGVLFTAKILQEARGAEARGGWGDISPQ